MTTIKTTINGTVTTISVHEADIDSIIDARLAKLAEEISNLKNNQASKDAFIQKHVGVKITSTYCKKDANDKKVWTAIPSEIIWEDIKSSKSHNTLSLSGYLTEQGIDKTLHGSANRGYLLAKTTIEHGERYANKKGIEFTAEDREDAIQTAIFTTKEIAVGCISNVVWKTHVVTFLSL